MIHNIKDVFEKSNQLMYDSANNELVIVIEIYDHFQINPQFWDSYLDQTKFLISNNPLHINKKVIVFK